MDEVAAALARYETVPMRGEVVEFRGVTVINDTQNCEPAAMRAALELLHDFDPAGRRIVICGDLAELGRRSIARHWQLGMDIVEIGGAELVIACGKFARHVTAGRAIDRPGAGPHGPLRHGRGGRALRRPGGAAGRRFASRGFADRGDGARDRGLAAIPPAEVGMKIV